MRAEKRLLRCLGVAAFGAMNVMLLSVALWAGAEHDPNPSTADLFHWLSALVALPTAAYAGMPFFESAARALARARRSTWTSRSRSASSWRSAMSLLQTDHARARRLLRERGDAADVPARGPLSRPADAPAHARLRRQPLRHPRRPRRQADGERRGGRDADRRDPAGRHRAGAPRRAHRRRRRRSPTAAPRSTRASSPARPRRSRWRAGAAVYAGAVNLTGALRVTVRAAASGTLLDEVNGLLAKAAEQRSSYIALADRAAPLYVPVVHVAAAATFLGWLALGAGWQQALAGRDHRADHHLSLRARPGGSGGAGGGGRRALPPRPDPQFRRGARTPRGGRRGRVRQDRHADPAEPNTGQRRATFRRTTSRSPARWRCRAGIRSRSARRRPRALWRP